MKELKLMAFTTKGLALAEKVIAGLDPKEWSCQAGTTRKESPFYINTSLGEWTRAAFQTAQAILFLGACGIAVRSIAPYLESKASDPAVLVADEGGNFVISLVSGHLGGANKLTSEVARILKAIPVITTATDVAGCFPVDVWAKEQGLAICGLKEAKAVSAALLEGRTVGFTSDFPVKGDLPQGLEWKNTGQTGIAVTIDETRNPFDTTLRLVPPVLCIGIGCCRGTGAREISLAVDKAFSQQGISPQAAAGVFSIDFKKDEPGLLAFCRERGLPFITYSATALGQLQGAFSSSPFVEEVTGIDNVCERSAVLGSGGGRLVIRKYTGKGVTVAAAQQDYTVSFDEL